jgi:dihydroorotate dehydrogenase
LVDDRAIVNRMGFNNEGAAAVAQRLSGRRRRPRGPVLGINIGKSKVVPDDDQAAVETDYETSTRLLAPYADYLVVNVSSPNTPGLRNLQAVEKLAPLLAHVLEVAELALAQDLSGVIATNTTTGREGLRSGPAEVEAAGAGGLSGAPLRGRATEVVSLLRGKVGPDLTLIGVGGISTPADARERLAAGADLVQAYTGLVYGGPLWPRRILKGLQ